MTPVSVIVNKKGTMAVLYIRHDNGSIQDLYPMSPDSLTDHNLMFSRQHFDDLKNSVVTMSPGDHIPGTQKLNVDQDMSLIWKQLKEMQWSTKRSGQTTITVEPSSHHSNWFYKLLLVILRLRVEYDTECKDGLPDVQFVLNEMAYKKMQHWANLLKPTGEHQLVHLAHLVAFGRLVHAQKPNIRGPVHLAYDDDGTRVHDSSMPGMAKKTPASGFEWDDSFYGGAGVFDGKRRVSDYL